jgi:hypothetical protein
MFLITIAVGMTSSSPPIGGVEIAGRFVRCAGRTACGGGDEESEEERSDV